MKIAIDIRCLMAKPYSGVAEYAYSLLGNIFKIDRQNQYLLFYNSSKITPADLPQFSYPNVQTLGLKYPNKIFNSSLKLFNYPKIDVKSGGADVFFMPNFNFVALSPHIKKIITVHDLSFNLYPRFFSWKMRLWHKFINPAKILNQSTKIIADSQNTKNDLLKIYNLPEEKIKVIYLGVDQLIYKTLAKDDFKFKKVQEKYHLPQKFILYLGTLEPRKNIESIIEAFALLKQNYNDATDLHLVIAGAQGWKCQHIFQTAQKSPYREQIKFTGYIEPKDKAYLYNLANVFVFPSFYEGFGLPVLEAQACGAPVIASLNSSFPEILQNSAFLINPDNTAEIAATMEQILADENLKQNLIAKGKENVKRFTWPKCAQETLDYLIA